MSQGRYERGFTAFKASLVRCSIRCATSIPEPGRDLELVEQLFGTVTAAAINKVGYIGDVEVPWVIETF